MMMKRCWRNVLYTVWDVFWIITGRWLSTWISRLSLSLQGCTYGRRFITTGPCSFKVRREGDIQIGDDVTFLAGWRSNRVGLSGMVLLQTLGEGKIRIGDGTGASAVVMSSRSEITIGRNVCIGGNARILDHDFHALDVLDRRLPMKDQESKIRTAPIRIGDNVFIGTNAIILKGVNIGDGAIVAAGTVVFRGEYPSGAIIAGNPASVVNSKNSSRES
jgi:acetyltransferase-like isoleucine patch superfamily enzyme